MGIIVYNISVNNEVGGRQHFKYKSIMKRYFKMDANKFYKLYKNKDVYFVVLDNKKHIRLDIYKNTPAILKRNIYYHKIISEHNIKVPKLLGAQETPNSIYKVSEWINGTRIGKVWTYPNMFKLAGEEIAKINMIKDSETNYNITFENFNKYNAIWTDKNIIYLNGNLFEEKKDIDGSVSKMLLKNISEKERIKWFLKGYSKVRNAYSIYKIVENHNYKWKMI